MRKIEVVDYTYEWGKKYETEAERVKEVFKNELLSLYHIGSNAIDRKLIKLCNTE